MSPALAFPPFEGPEKKLDVVFAPTAGSGTDPGAASPSLRTLPRATIDALLTSASCTVLSVISSDTTDAYLLSESSLFVSDTRFLIKTCGTTTLLHALPVLLAHAVDLGLAVILLQYSRAAYLFPIHQLFPHATFADEVAFLNQTLGPDRTGVALQIGSGPEPAAWHLYVSDISASSDGRLGADGIIIVDDSTKTAQRASESSSAPSTPSPLDDENEDRASEDSDRDLASNSSPMSASDDLRDSLGSDEESRQAIEIFMFDLDPTAMTQYFRSADPKPARGLAVKDEVRELSVEDRRAAALGTTHRAGISNLLNPDTAIDAYDFDPCGYSMNGLVASSVSTEDSAYYTVHITPEPEASYVSFETSLESSELAPLIAAVVKLFQPARFAAAFIGTPQCAALRENPSAPISWTKLSKLLSQTFRCVEDPALIKLSSRCVVAVGNFVRVADPENLAVSAKSDPCVADADSGFESGLSSNSSANASGDIPAARVSNVVYVKSEDHNSAADADLISARGKENSVMNGAPTVVAFDMKAAKAKAKLVAASVRDDGLLDDKFSTVSMSTSGSGDESFNHLSSGDLSPVGSISDLAANIDCGIDVIALADIVSETIDALENPLCVVDLGVVSHRIDVARHEFGLGVGLRYSVRCNPDPKVLRAMDAAAVDFEASSMAEVAMLRAAGIDSGRIAVVSPTIMARAVRHMGFVRSVAVYPGNVNSAYLHVLANLEIAVEVRVGPGTSNDALVTCNAAIAAGCRIDALGLDLAPDAAFLPESEFYALLKDGLCAIDEVLAALPSPVSRHVRVSLGEQYPGARDATTDKFSSFASDVLGNLLPRVVVDASRYIVGPAVVLLATVIGRRCRNKTENTFNYYLNDGVYGAFSMVLVEDGNFSLQNPLIFSQQPTKAFNGPSVDCTLFGPTCDALDRIWTGMLPTMQVGDVVAFRGMGGYTSSTTSHFNGFSRMFDTRYIECSTAFLFGSQ
jgi:diaminopimelate decarboxylase